jgi:hypothetical protein
MILNYILFWSTYKDGDTLEDFTNRELELSKAHNLSLYSHIKAGQNTYLYTYQDISKSSVPEGIILKDANDVYPSKDAWEALQRGHSIAHVSDVVRISEAIRLKGVVMDMDLTILRNITEYESFYSSLPAKMTGTLAPQWKDKHPPIYIHDGSWDGKALCGFPLKISDKTSEKFIPLVEKIKDSLSKPPKKSSKAWNYVLWTVKEIIKTDLDGKVFQPLYNLPIPAWKGAGKCYSIDSPSKLDGKTIIYGHRMPSITEILSNSNYVGHFFESAFTKSESVSDDFWLELKDDCMLAREAEYLIGEKWRDFLNNYNKI